MMITVSLHRRKSWTKTVSDSILTLLQHISETQWNLNYKYPFNHVKVVLMFWHSFARNMLFFLAFFFSLLGHLPTRNVCLAVILCKFTYITKNIMMIFVYNSCFASRKCQYPTTGFECCDKAQVRLLVLMWFPLS